MELLRRRRSPASMKRLYDWFHRYYGPIERSLEPTLDEVVRAKIATLENSGAMTALDYACGSGGWTLKIAPHFRCVKGRDQSLGMLSRAQERARQAGCTVAFCEGSILEIDDDDCSVDWVFVSFALHLFAPDTVVKILKDLLRVARKGVMIVDHSRKWGFGIAVAEWLEGSYYDHFIRTDFAAVAREIAADHFEEVVIGDAMILTFGKSSTDASHSGS